MIVGRELPRRMCGSLGRALRRSAAHCYGDDGGHRAPGAVEQEELLDEGSVPSASWSYRDRHRARGRDRCAGAVIVGEHLGDRGHRWADGYPASGNIQSKVGDGCRGNYRAHEGIDISAAGGTPILAAYSGVIKSRTVNSGYGNYTDVEHPGGYVTRYAHMASPGTYAPGTRVERGQQIGIVGNTGNSPAYHLHFEVRRNGAVYTGINDGFVCLTNVARGGTIPLTFPGLRTESGPPIPPADFTGDGRSDLLLVAGNGDLRLRAGTGSGGFQAPTTLVSGWAGDRRHLTRADLNGDGRGDVLAARTDGVLEFSAGNGAGGVAAPVGIGAGWYDMLHVTSGADLHRRRKQDVVGVSPGVSSSSTPGTVPADSGERPRPSAAAGTASTSSSAATSTMTGGGISWR